MLGVLKNTWALLLGMAMLMLGNGMQGTLLGIRGGIENFSTWHMSIVMSAYFLGFLFGSHVTPEMIRRVGHVRVFAALGSMISAVLILYAAAPHWMMWAALRVIIGFCFAGVYITAESWLNDSATNTTRGQTLSMYLMVQMFGIVAAQGLLNFGDPSGYILFVIPSVLVSLAFAPILLSVAKAPVFSTTKRMSIRDLYMISPLGCGGMFLVGGVISSLFGMSSVWAAEVGLSVWEVTLFVSSIYIGGMLFQFPIGWLSDRMDRRKIMLWLSVFGAIALVQPMFFDLPMTLIFLIGAISGAVANPLYSLLLAYVNDYIETTDMAAASAGLMFITGLGSISGPLITGWMMGAFGSSAFFLFSGILYAALALYALWRMKQRPINIVSTANYTPIMPSASVVAVEAALEQAALDESEIEDGEDEDEKAQAAV